MEEEKQNKDHGEEHVQDQPTVYEKPVIDENKVIQTIILGSDWQEVLTTLVSEEGMDPLDVNLINLTDSFMTYLQRLEKFDFRVPARFILVAAILLRMKTELMLEEEEKKQLRQGEQINPINIDDVPLLTPPLLRTPTRKVTLDELISALNKAFVFQEKKEGKELRMRKAVENLISEPKEDVEARINRIFNQVVKAHTIMFSKMLPEWKRLYIVEYLLPLLHLSIRGKITMDQKEMFDDIEIMIIDDKKEVIQ
jgi:segregation and condensation protein A